MNPSQMETAADLRHNILHGCYDRAGVITEAMSSGHKNGDIIANAKYLHCQTLAEF